MTLNVDRDKILKKHSLGIAPTKEEESFDENPLKKLLDGETEEDAQMREEALKVRRRGSTVIQIPDATIQMDLHTLYMNTMSQDKRKGSSVDDSRLKKMSDCDLATSPGDENDRKSGPFTLFKTKGKRRGGTMGHSFFRDFKDFLEYLRSNLFETTENEVSNLKGSHWSTIGNFCDCNVTDSEMAQQAGLSEQERLRFEALWELFYAEVTYLLDNLLVLQDVFVNTLEHAKKYGFLLSVDETTLFGNIQPLIKVTTDFATMLLRIFQECGAEVSRSTEIIVNGFKEFPNLLTPQYSDYYLNYRQAISYLKSKKGDDNFAEFIKICENQSRCARRQLEDLLVCPLQHLTKYPLLLKAIRKRTPADDPNHDLLSDTISNLEDSIKSIERRFSDEVNMVRIREISESLFWPLVVENDNKFTLPDVMRMDIIMNTPSNILLENKDRTLIQEGFLILADSNKLDVYVFLFSDMILLTKVRKKVKRPTLPQNQEECKPGDINHSKSMKKGSIQENMGNMLYTVYKQPVAMDRLQLFDFDDQSTGIKHGFYVVQFNRFHQVLYVYTFQASTDDLKQQWIKNIKKAKDKLTKSKEIDVKISNLTSSKDIKVKITDCSTTQNGTSTVSDEAGYYL